MRRLKTAKSASVRPPDGERQREFQVYIVFTDIEATKLALKTAIQLTCELNARLVLLVTKVVPWPLSLEYPPVSNEFTERVLSELASEQKADITARIYLCRDRDFTLRRALKPHSVVVIGSRKRWWPNRTPPLARLLSRDGHHVILAARGNQPTRVVSSTVKSSHQAL